MEFSTARNATSALGTANQASPTTRALHHEMLDLSACQQLSEWIEADLEGLEQRFRSFWSSQSIMTTIR